MRSHGVVTVQFLVALNLFLGGKSNISRNALTFNLKKTNEDQVISRIIEKLPKGNDKYYTNHLKCSNTFVLGF